MGEKLVSLERRSRLWNSLAGSRYPKNPVVIREPDHLDVTGFRDPSIFEWPALGDKFGYNRLAVLSGGVQGEVDGPRMFLFGVDPSNLASWTFLQTLGTMKRNARLDTRWSGDFGTNWECGTFFPLKHNASGIERMIGVVGVEGGHIREHVKSYRKLNPSRPHRDSRYCNWFFANLTKDKDNDIHFDTTGMMDSGEWYAPSVFQHPDGRRIAWGWIVEQDISERLAAEKGWIGCLGIPRELSLGVYEGVIGTCSTSLAEITSVEVESAQNRIVTLDIRPLRELESLRRASLYKSTPTSTENGIILKQAPDCYELLLRAEVNAHGNGSISLKIRESSSVNTTVSFDSQREELVIHRQASSVDDEDEGGICLQDEIAALTLFRYTSHFESLELRVFVDKDVVEVFANGRAAIATRIYAPKNASGISIAQEGELTVTEMQIWELGGIGLVN